MYTRLYSQEALKVSLEPRDTPQGIVGIAFARALVAGEYDVAHSMPSAPLQAALPPAQLKEKLESMIEYGGSPFDFVDVTTILDDWPAKKVADIGWAYVTIGGDVYSEAVTVVVTQEQTKHAIREIEWGRP